MIIHICQNCRYEIDHSEDGTLPLCPLCASPLREESREPRSQETLKMIEALYAGRLKAA